MIDRARDRTCQRRFRLLGRRESHWVRSTDHPSACTPSSRGWLDADGDRQRSCNSTRSACRHRSTLAGPAAARNRLRETHRRHRAGESWSQGRGRRRGRIVHPECPQVSTYSGRYVVVAGSTHWRKLTGVASRSRHRCSVIRLTRIPGRLRNTRRSSRKRTAGIQWRRLLLTTEARQVSSKRNEPMARRRCVRPPSAKQKPLFRHSAHGFSAHCWAEPLAFKSNDHPPNADGHQRHVASACCCAHEVARPPDRVGDGRTEAVPVLYSADQVRSGCSVVEDH